MRSWRREVDVTQSDLIEIAKRSAVFKETYGKWWGGFIQLSLANKAVGRSPLLWSGLVGAVPMMAGLILKYGLLIVAR
jgi:hypothetical protein